LSKSSKIKNGLGGKQNDSSGDMNNQLLMGMFQAQQEIINRLHQHEIFIASLQELLVENNTLTEDNLKKRIEKLSNELKQQLEERQREMEEERNKERQKIETEGTGKNLRNLNDDEKEGLVKKIPDVIKNDNKEKSGTE
jgi:DNA-binding transcriptional MerR regulator